MTLDPSPQSCWDVLVMDRRWFAHGNARDVIKVARHAWVKQVKGPAAQVAWQYLPVPHSQGVHARFGGQHWVLSCSLMTAFLVTRRGQLGPACRAAEAAGADQVPHACSGPPLQLKQEASRDRLRAEALLVRRLARAPRMVISSTLLNMLDGTAAVSSRKRTLTLEAAAPSSKSRDDRQIEQVARSGEAGPKSAATRKRAATDDVGASNCMLESFWDAMLHDGDEGGVAGPVVGRALAVGACASAAQEHPQRPVCAVLADRGPNKSHKENSGADGAAEADDCGLRGASQDASCRNGA